MLDFSNIEQSPNTNCGFVSAPPTITRPPPAMVMGNAGDTITIECTAVGVPTPFINWRLNWGHVPPPPRVMSTSENGVGKLTIKFVYLRTWPCSQAYASCIYLHNMSIVNNYTT